MAQARYHFCAIKSHALCQMGIARLSTLFLCIIRAPRFIVLLSKTLWPKVDIMRGIEETISSLSMQVNMSSYSFLTLASEEHVLFVSLCSRISSSIASKSDTAVGFSSGLSCKHSALIVSSLAGRSNMFDVSIR